jgi:CubicO group peptidase (beta-lactamase class C family)
VFAKGYGLADLEYNIKNTDSTIFHMASISKQFTAFSIVLLARAGKLKLDDDIHKYLPWFPDLKTKITIRILLNHTSGIRDQWQLLAIQGTRMDDVITQKHIVKILAQQRGLNFPTGTQWGYSNSNFTLAAEIVKAVTGQSLRQFADSAIFRPLKMSHTHFHDDYTEIVKNRAYSYSRKGDHYANSILSYSNVGATSLFTNVDDMARWLSNFYEHEVGDQADVDTLTAKSHLNSGKVLDYALGINNGEHKGWKEFSHGGADAGYRTYVAVYPEKELAVIAFGNVEDFDAGGVAGKIADLLLQDKSPTGSKASGAAANSTSASQPPSPKDTAAAVLASADLAAIRPYLGSYVADNGVALDLAVENGKLYYVIDGGHQLLVKDSTNRYVMFYAHDVQFTIEPFRSTQPLHSPRPAQSLQSAEPHKRPQALGPLHSAQSHRRPQSADSPQPLRSPQALEPAQSHARDTAVDVKAPGQEFRLVKYTPVNPKDERLLDSYLGSYYCPELGCTYGIAIKDHHLVLTNNKYDDAPLRLAGPDRLLNDYWWMNNLTVKRNAAHKITGFEVDAGRVAHLVFKKIN